ncbi:MAG TPA: GNAT family N-acetyltransferase [Chlorobaculum parvum]|uniref:GNAT family N-acetyltransferase n=1 Tax=Chlorobaculum parvum TaxID=274539 RepID=A0A7C5HN94_9CHLB|nr:GNAT family N-acetyltransferase [Chlorobaculum parvum]
MSLITVSKVLSSRDRLDALSVIEEVFVREKQWMQEIEEQIPHDLDNNREFSWFLARVNGKPAGIMRLQYDPSLELPESCQASFEPGIDMETLKAAGQYVEIGRFMIRPQFRHQYRVALRLMRAATAEVVERGYTHFITDVFKGEEHSPLNFHTRVLGFEVIGSHLFGELNCSSTRIILTLDILKLYNRIKDSRSRLYQELAEGLRGKVEAAYAKRRGFRPQV